MIKKRHLLYAALPIAALALLQSCASIPKKATPVEGFDVARYLGDWYEIARFDYRFERNLDNVIAQYTQKTNGEIGVLNSGYHFKKGEWKSASGVAKFRGDENIGALKVSFFKPFYAAYNVIAIDENYRYALVAGKNLQYLWLLSRDKTIPDEIKTSYLQLAEEIGYDISELIWVKHDKENPYQADKAKAKE